jgi:hypothetical protein
VCAQSWAGRPGLSKHAGLPHGAGAERAVAGGGPPAWRAARATPAHALAARSRARRAPHGSPGPTGGPRRPAASPVRALRSLRARGVTRRRAPRAPHLYAVKLLRSIRGRAGPEPGRGRAWAILSRRGARRRARTSRNRGHDWDGNAPSGCARARPGAARRACPVVAAQLARVPPPAPPGTPPPRPLAGTGKIRRPMPVLASQTVPIAARPAPCCAAHTLAGGASARPLARAPTACGLLLLNRARDCGGAGPSGSGCLRRWERDAAGLGRGAGGRAGGGGSSVARPRYGLRDLCSEPAARDGHGVTPAAHAVQTGRAPPLLRPRAARRAPAACRRAAGRGGGGNAAAAGLPVALGVPEAPAALGHDAELFTFALSPTDMTEPALVEVGGSKGGCRAALPCCSSAGRVPWFLCCRLHSLGPADRHSSPFSPAEPRANLAPPPRPAPRPPRAPAPPPFP